MFASGWADSIIYLSVSRYRKDAAPKKSSQPLYIRLLALRCYPVHKAVERRFIAFFSMLKVLHRARMSIDLKEEMT